MLMFAATVGQTISSVHAAQSDVIDTSRTASLTIHKYDMTAAQKGGVDLSQFTATGKQDAKAEEALKKYPIDHGAGVQPPVWQGNTGGHSKAA